MKYMITWNERPQGTPIEYENAQKRILEVFSPWKAPANFKIESFIIRVGDWGGYIGPRPVMISPPGVFDCVWHDRRQQVYTEVMLQSHKRAMAEIKSSQQRVGKATEERDKLKEKLKKAQARLTAEKEHLRMSREKLES